MRLLSTAVFISFVCLSLSAPQQPEINDQFDISDPVNQTAEPETKSPTAQSVKEEAEEAEIVVNLPVVEEIPIVKKETVNQNTTIQSLPEVSFTVRIYKIITEPIIKVVNTPKVSAVLRNIGTCVVNGAMELFSYYLPAPFMPLIASAAGLVIPFEPVVMLKEKMPVTSYRRAFQTAMSSFLRTFDKYKVEEDYDPYMTRRFNRRFMNDNQAKNEEVKI